MKNNICVYLILGIYLTVITAIIFILPVDKSDAAWISYTFFVISIIVEGALIKYKDSDIETKILSIPLWYIGGIYVLIQTIVLFTCVLFFDISGWISAIFSIVFLGIVASSLIAFDFALKQIQGTNRKISEKVNYINEIRIELELLQDKVSGKNNKNVIASLCRKVRFSDPMSSEKLSTLEKEILDLVKEISDMDEKTMPTKLDEISRKIDERNKRCLMK